MKNKFGFILVKTQLGENIGACARSMKNFGFSKLHIVSPKINFPNEHAVFLHDTPRKSLFNEEIRYFSSGCVRVQNIDDLIDWLLSESDNWNEDLLHEILNSSVTKTLRLDAEIPIKIGYLTAWVENGQIQFRDDIYKKDSIYK